jgi:predicted nuclease of predicted toxin-antitoxin system
VAEQYLADENFPRLAVAKLRAVGLDVAFVAEFAPGLDDHGVASEAIRRDAVLLTFDRDFGELTFRHGVTVPGIVLFRLRQQPPWVVLAFLEAFFTPERTLRGYFTVASPGQVRQRPMLRLVDGDT